MMIYALCAVGGVVIGIVLTMATVFWYARREEQRGFRNFWGP